MTPAAPLLLRVLADPADPVPRLVLADWLEDRGNPDDDLRASLLRLQAEYLEPSLTDADRRDVSRRLPRPKRLKRFVGPLVDLRAVRVPILAQTTHLPAFLLADHLEPTPVLPVDAHYAGTLHEHHYRFPVSFLVHTRENGRFAATMLEDFEAQLGFRSTAVFWVRGVVVGGRLLFAQDRIDGPGQSHVLYDLELKPGGRLSGDWRVAMNERRGVLRLRRASEPRPTR